MKKIFVAIAALLVGALLVSAVSAADCYGREREFVDGNVVFFNQKVVVTNQTCAFSFMPIETFEHCTVTITTHYTVKIVTEDGEQIRSTNGFRFEFGTSAFFGGNAWNNIPRSGENPEVDDTANVEAIANSIFEFFNSKGNIPLQQTVNIINQDGITVTDASGNEFTMTSAGDFVPNDSFVSGTVTGNGFVAIITAKLGTDTPRTFGTIIGESIEMKGQNGVFIITSTGGRITVFDDN